MKKRDYLIAGFLAILIVLPLASAGIFDFMTGKATSGTTDVNIPVGNTGPIIIYVSPIAAVSPIENNQKTVYFSFHAYDHDGTADLSDASAAAKFTKGGEATRSTSSACTKIGDLDAKTANYTCSIVMWYWDGDGIWDVNATIIDLSSAVAVNETTTFSYSTLAAFTMAPESLTWSTLLPGATGQESNNEPTNLSNTGNDESTNIQINATDLLGNSDATKAIIASGFQSKISAPATGGTSLVNVTFTQVSGAALPNGNLSAGEAIENLYYAVDVPASVTKQTYSTTTTGAWTIKAVY